MIPVKICGNTRLEDALFAAACGAHALGFVFYPPSPRSVSPEAAAEITRALPPYVVRVGVFVDEAPETINRVAEHCGLDRIQLHGGEPYETLVRLNRPGYRVFRLRARADLEALAAAPDDTVLLDTYDKHKPGGSGRAFNWDWAREAARHKRVILAGGLGPDNIARAVEAARPAGVDVSSALEASPGVKDHRRIEQLFRALAAREAPTPLRDEHASAS